MNRELALEVSRVTEAASLATFNHIGRGDKIASDKAAVDAMRDALSKLDIKGKVIIGEGEIDDAPMLYIGEIIGQGKQNIEIAVDPIDGTRMVALGQENAVSVMAVADEGVLLQAPDMYMEKIMVNYHAKNCIDINLPIVDNVKNVARKLNKSLSEIKVVTLAKPRHEYVINELQSLGVKVIAVPDGDVAASILVAMPKEKIDMFYGIGGAPEGVISAAIIRSMDGDMQAKLITREDCKGKSTENIEITKKELKRCSEMDIKVGEKLTLDDLCKNDNVIVSMTGITDGTLLKGVSISDEIGTTETLMIRGKSRTIRKIISEHFIDRKDENLKKIIKGEK